MPVKIKVSGFTILVAALAFFSHAAVPLGHIFFILALHESGHAFWAWFFHYPIRQLSILPFGLALTLEHFGDGDAWEELVILAGGLAMHGVIPLLYGGLAKLGWVSPVMLDWVSTGRFFCLMCCHCIRWTADGSCSRCGIAFCRIEPRRR